MLSEQKDNRDGLNDLAGCSFRDIDTRALEGVRQVHHNGGVPCITVIIEKMNAQHIGELIYFAS